MSMLVRVLLLLIAVFMVSCVSAPEKSQKERAEPPSGAYYEYMRGYEAELSGDWEEALKHYREALSLDPTSNYLRTQISYIYLRTGKVQEAIDTAETVIKSDPNYTPALMLLAQMYNSQKRLDEAMSLYERVIAVDHWKSVV